MLMVCPIFYPREKSNHGRQNLAMKGMKLLGFPYFTQSCRYNNETEKERIELLSAYYSLIGV
eukprot:scaffold13592_cov111-Skeletonema_dohrnii-CCMP3373.AAC.2